MLIALVTVVFGCQSHTVVLDTDDANDHVQRTSDLASLIESMSNDELFAAGITAVDGGLWSVAWSTDSEEDIVAINRTLEKVNLSALGSFGHGRGGWYIEKEDFFSAQAALKQSEDVIRLGIKIVEPRIPLADMSKNDEHLKDSILR